MLLYLAGPYSFTAEKSIDQHIQQARQIAIEVWTMGHVALTPHLNTYHFEEDCQLGYEAYMEGDMILLARCDGMLMLPGWEASRGATREHAEAERLGMPIFYYPALPELGLAETRCPIQVKGFAELLGQMHRTHLAKNADYSPLNIKGTGEFGVVVRSWDKICRLLNLYGIRVDGEFLGLEPPRTPKNESIDDTWMDLAVYAMIGKLVREGKWGK